MPTGQMYSVLSQRIYLVSLKGLERQRQKQIEQCRIKGLGSEQDQGSQTIRDVEPASPSPSPHPGPCARSLLPALLTQTSGFTSHSTPFQPVFPESPTATSTSTVPPYTAWCLGSLVTPAEEYSLLVPCWFVLLLRGVIIACLYVCPPL